MSFLPKQFVISKLEEYLKEDAPFGDITSFLIPEIEVTGSIVSKEEGCVCGLAFAEMLFEHYGLKVESRFSDGKIVPKGIKVLTFSGPAKNVLILERTVLNIIMRLSGIATKTYKLVERVNKKKLPIKIAATRKTTPGFRYFEKYAVIIGGGDPHRWDLSDSVLIKENHLQLYENGDLSAMVQLAKKKSSFTKKIEVEVETLTQLKEVVDFYPDIILLDNFTPEAVKKAVAHIEGLNSKTPPIIELSGGINEENIENYLIPGVNVISLGALTHSYSSMDFSLDIDQ